MHTYMHAYIRSCSVHMQAPSNLLCVCMNHAWITHLNIMCRLIDEIPAYLLSFSLHVQLTPPDMYAICFSTACTL